MSHERWPQCRKSPTLASETPSQKSTQKQTQIISKEKLGGRLDASGMDGSADESPAWEEVRSHEYQVGKLLKFLLSSFAFYEGTSISPGSDDASPRMQVILFFLIPHPWCSLRHDIDCWKVELFGSDDSSRHYASCPCRCHVKIAVRATFTLSSLPRQAPNTTPVDSRGPSSGAQHEIGVVNPPQSTAGQGTPPPQFNYTGVLLQLSHLIKPATRSNDTSLAVQPTSSSNSKPRSK
eukprot:scaffold26473_cov138-Skeletonema_dohrnii-CCMP3373.AAC.4